MRLFAAAAMLALGGCATMGQRPTTLSGPWGGPHIGLNLEGGLGTIEYDCASGTVDQTIPAADGSFSVSGTHRTGQGGPIRVGQIFQSQRATYAGQVTGDQMILNVVLEDGTALGPFTLVRGAAPQLNRCL